MKSSKKYRKSAGGNTREEKNRVVVAHDETPPSFKSEAEKMKWLGDRYDKYVADCRARDKDFVANIKNP